MAREGRSRRGGRLSRSGHTTHRPVDPAAAASEPDDGYRPTREYPPQAPAGPPPLPAWRPMDPDVEDGVDAPAHGDTSRVPPFPSAGDETRPVREVPPPRGAYDVDHGGYDRPRYEHDDAPRYERYDDAPTEVHRRYDDRDRRELREPPRYEPPRYDVPRYERYDDAPTEVHRRYDDRYPDEHHRDVRYPDERSLDHDKPYRRRHDAPRYDRYDDAPTEVHRRYDDRHADQRYRDERPRGDYPDERYRDDRPRGGYSEERYRDDRYRDDRYRDDRYPDDRYADPRPADARHGYDAAAAEDRFPHGTRGVPLEVPGGPGTAGTPTDAAAGRTGSGAAVDLGKAAVKGTNRAARAVTNKVITASKANGADKSGLTPLIWNQVLSYGTDAMVTVALAGTVFFGASAHAQRGNVLLYLLITMAPFAVIAPVIGPALDRLQHGRRWTMAFTGIGRAVLALVMAAHATDLLVLYPCALGSLVLSKAYGVVRAAAAPRLVPPGMTLTEANARLTIFGLGSTVVLGGLVGAIIKVTGSYGLGLVVTAIGFGACAFFAFSLPKQVDSAQAAPRHPEEPTRPRAQQKVPPLSRLGSWARKGFPPHLVIALQGESGLRLLSGMLTIYLAFYVESTSHGLTGVLELGMVIGAAGVGNFLGTAIGTRLRMDRPEFVVVVATCVSGAICFAVAVIFNPGVAAMGMLIASIGNALGKIALDALIQRDVVETLRSSAFGKSETFLQLAWVIGAALGVVLPSDDGDGPIGFVVAGVIVTATGALIALRLRAMPRTTGRTEWNERPDAPGSVVPRSVD